MTKGGKLDDAFDQAAVQARLLAELQSLESEDAAGGDDRATVALDQQSVGRLSRMDAMQRQAMAQATDRRRGARRRRIAAALERIDAGGFGWCAECGEPIAPRRLQLDPTVPNCIGCARS